MTGEGVSVESSCRSTVLIVCKAKKNDDMANCREGAGKGRSLQNRMPMLADRFSMELKKL